MKYARSVPAYLWPSDHQRKDHRGEGLRRAAQLELDRLRSLGMPDDLGGALRWMSAMRELIED